MLCWELKRFFVKKPVFYLKSHGLIDSTSCIPSPTININTSENEAFTADNLNTAKSHFDITDCWLEHYKHANKFQSSLSCYNGVYKENYIHKCETEKLRIF